MYQKVTDYLKSYNTINDVPLHQILTPSDIHHIAATVTNLATPKGVLQFEDLYHTMFLPLGDNAKKYIDYKILQSVFELNDVEVPEAVIMEIAFYCLMSLQLEHDLPVLRVLEVVTDYIESMKISKEETRHSYNPVYHISNLIPIGDGKFIRSNGKTIVPTTEALRLEFINKVKQLLIP